jgi:hypothetical protein
MNVTAREWGGRCDLSGLPQARTPTSDIKKFAIYDANLIAIFPRMSYERPSSISEDAVARCYFSAKTAGTAKSTAARRAAAPRQKARRS